MPHSATWSVWGLEAHIAVTDGAGLSPAEQTVRSVLSEVDAACSRFNPDSELRLLQDDFSSGARISSLFASLVRQALDAAMWTEGDVDPTLGRDLDGLGYDRDFSRIMLDQNSGEATKAQRKVTPGWQQIFLVGQTLTVPEGLRLDLGATAKAAAADLAAQRVAETLGCGVLVALGGDIATAGGLPMEGWQVLVQDLSTDPSQQVTLPANHAIATSSTQKRRWRSSGVEVHHILDPRFGTPAEPVWRSVTVAAQTCLVANSFSTAAIVRGFKAPDWYRRNNVAGRFVDQQGRITTTGGWPEQSTGPSSTGPIAAAQGGPQHG